MVAPPQARALAGWLTPQNYGVISLAVVGVVALLSPNFGVAAIAGGITSLVVAVGALVFLALDKERAARVMWAVAAVVLVIVGALGLVGNTAAFQLSIAQDESSGNYSGAIAALRSIGKAPPYSSDLAQAYLDWAQQEVKEKAFAGAVTHLNYVVQNFPTLPQAADAQNRLPGVYLAWAQYATQQNDPVTAGQQYAILLTQYASSPEAAQAHDAAGPAFLAWGNAEQQAKYYDVAYTAYQLVAHYFPKSTEAAEAHRQAATDLLAWAQALTAAHRYADAAVHYTDLAKNYADTPEGKTAQGILNKGVQLIGRLLRANGVKPVMPFTTVRLSSQWTVSNGSYVVGGQQYYADTDSNGYFVFPSVPAGQYLLEWRSTSGPFLTLFNGTTPLDVVTLRPLQNLTLPPIITNQ